MVRKAAVVIGVNKTGGLTPLSSAANGAQRVAEWLSDEGYDVECITDEKEPVKSGAIEEAIGKFVDLPIRYQLLVVYFSGHGYWNAGTDLWLLSGAPKLSSQAINLRGAMDLAKYSGVANVVFISDACRSLPDTHSAAEVDGVDGFPVLDGVQTVSKVDVFLATGRARSAFESVIDGEPRSILTTALLSAYEEPEPDMVRELVVGSETVAVVPNRALEDYLQSKVTSILGKIDRNLTQRIEANVPSKDDVYISKVRGQPQPTGGADHEVGSNVMHAAVRPAVGPSVGNDAAQSIESAIAPRPRRRRGGTRPRPSPPPAAETAASIASREPDERIDHFETKVGLVVRGARVERVVTMAGDQGPGSDLVDPGDGDQQSAVIRLWDVEPAASVGVLLDDGRCVVLAALKGYIGHAAFDGDGLANVSYVPSSNTERWELYSRRREQVDRLRALAALAVEHNTFRIRSEKEARALGSTIRMQKRVDPTLGLYAAHALSQAGNENGVVDVLGYMDNDLRAQLFDIRVLASRRLRDFPTELGVVPFCPMLTQTWNLLRPRRIRISSALDEARAHLCDSLWTTFRPQVAESVLELVETGGAQCEF